MFSEIFLVDAVRRNVRHYFYIELEKLILTENFYLALTKTLLLLLQNIYSNARSYKEKFYVLNLTV